MLFIIFTVLIILVIVLLGWLKWRDGRSVRTCAKIYERKRKMYREKCKVDFKTKQMNILCTKLFLIKFLFRKIESNLHN